MMEKFIAFAVVFIVVIEARGLNPTDGVVNPIISDEQKYGNSRDPIDQVVQQCMNNCQTDADCKCFAFQCLSGLYCVSFFGGRDNNQKEHVDTTLDQILAKVPKAP